ncbi:sensor histidine kinase [Microvirga sp. Mcv34]|uniref:sensor histidine kinase n=1 Tax=Microvirga sp. Mcv34 TaxID=2926016 RepID=UPI0021C7F75F|nr:PAS domain-containing protein [Microvirga sp. Mcv34]
MNDECLGASPQPKDGGTGVIPGQQENPAAGHEHLLALALKARDLGLWWIDLENDQFHGDAICRRLLLGADDSPGPDWPMSMAAFLALLHPDDRALTRTRLQRTFEAGYGSRYVDEFRVLRPSDGAPVWIAATGMVDRPPDGKPHGRSSPLRLVGTLQDMTRDDPGIAGVLEGEARLKAILNTMPQMVWSARPDGYHDYYNDRWYEFTGTPYGSTDGDAWSGMFHPDDQNRAWERWRHSLATGEPYEVDYRLRRHDGEYRWTLGRALPIRRSDGSVERWFGTCTDVHDLKSSEEQRELIGRELSHRIKNIFAVVSSLVTLTSRGDDAAKPFASEFLQRLNGLAQAHEYIQPHTPWFEVEPTRRTVLHLLAILIRPYAQEQAAPPEPSNSPHDRRVAVAGDDAPVGVSAGTALALIVHELATNAIKYGSLSQPDGRVTITGESLAGTEYRLTWQERNGPAVEGPPTRQGFGTRLAQKSATSQLGAVMEQDWSRDGLTVRLTMQTDTLSR